MKHWTIAACLAALSTTAFGQVAAPIAAVAIPAADAVLPRNTPVSLSLNETLNTKSANTRKGSTFTLSVVNSVQLGGYIVIPRGAKAVGTVVWRTGKGAFGKSGKMEISLDYIDVGDQRIAIEGHHREEGEGNADATMATFVFLSMLGSGLITGHSAEIPAGREFAAWTREDVPVRLPGGAALPPRPAAAGIVAPPALPASSGVLVATLPASTRRVPTPEQDAAPPHVGNSHVRCLTCRQ